MDGWEDERHDRLSKVMRALAWGVLLGFVLAGLAVVLIAWASRGLN